MIFDPACEISMSRPGSGNSPHSRVQMFLCPRISASLSLCVPSFRRHDLPPVLPILILYGNGNGSAQGYTSAYSCCNLGSITLYFHPPAAAISLLPPFQIPVNVLSGQRQTCWNTLHNQGKAFSMRFTRSQKTYHLSVPFSSGQ